MKKRNYFLIIVLIAILLGIFVFLEYFPLKQISDSTTQEGCEKLNGRWELIGLSDEEECNLPTSDFGKICHDRSDCEGECIAELTSEEISKAINQSIDKYGKCSEYRIIAGCNYLVNSGKVNGLICID